MRITRDSLIQAARQAAAQQLRKDRRMVCIYLTGSLLSDEPLLGHTTDIDLFFIHDTTPEKRREIQRLSDEIHLDIAHFAQNDFRQPREQRSDPWLSPFICNNPIILHDTQHWFEFTQASVCAQYGRPEYTLQRARKFSIASRQTWLELKSGAVSGAGNKVYQYLKAVENAANSIASLSNRPLTERRFILEYPYRAEEIGRPDLSDSFTSLFIPSGLSTQSLVDWLEDWEEAFILAGNPENSTVQPPARLDPNRLTYYKSAAQALKDENPAAALWPLIRTWTLAALTLPDHLRIQEKWLEAVNTLGLGPERMEERIHTLDTYLDTTEETLDIWANNMGVVQA